MVNYVEGDQPVEDVLGLRCTLAGRMMVTAVRDGGPAANVGVMAGDQLLSINGRKDFTGFPAQSLHRSITPTTMAANLWGDTP